MFLRFERICRLIVLSVTVGSVAASAQTPPDQTDYIRNVIQKAREASGVQEFPAVQDAKPPGQAEAAPSTSSTTTSTLPAAAGSNRTTGKVYNVRHGDIPQSRNYWRFLNFYRSHAVVSLVVSGIDDKALTRALEELARLQRQGVQIGEIIVTGGKFIADLNAVETPTDPPVNSELTADEAKIRRTVQKKKVSELSKLSLNVGLGIGEPVDVTPILERLAVKYSPTWVVRYHGQDYVYEGLENPSSLFSKDGVFRGGDR